MKNKSIGSVLDELIKNQNALMLQKIVTLSEIETVSIIKDGKKYVSLDVIREFFQ